MSKDDISYDEFLRATRQMAAILEYGGVPGRQAVNVAIGLSDIARGEASKGALEIGGMSPYMAEKRTK